MSDNVKAIFKALIRVPVIIFVSYFIFNLFAFTLNYFKLLGFSYVVLQTAAENNYIPEDEYNKLDAYLKSITDNGVIDNAKIITTDGSGIKDARQKRQYGEPVVVGVEAHYKFIMPLMPNEQIQGKFDGVKGGRFGGYLSSSELENKRKQYENNKENNIRIVYKIPGLKYYPDLD
ncbi:MAG: hypothetical protein QXD03_03970 [Candidatus Anstonellales archaeon]